MSGKEGIASLLINKSNIYELDLFVLKESNILPNNNISKKILMVKEI